MDDFLSIAAQDFARDVDGLQEDVVIEPDGKARSFNLPAGTQDVFSAYYEDAIEDGLVEADDVRALADPDYREGASSSFPTSYAVKAGRPPVIWLNSVPEVDQHLHLTIRKNAIGWPVGDSGEPDLAEGYQVAIAFKAAAYAAMTQFDESVRLLRDADYKAKVDKYVEERNRKQSTAARLRGNDFGRFRSGRQGGLGGLVGVIAGGDGEMAVTLDQVYGFVKTILSSSDADVLRIVVNDETQRVQLQPIGSDLDVGAVDARVAAGVEDWAEAGNTDPIPGPKLPDPVVPGLDRAAVDARVAAGVEDWAEAGNTDPIPGPKLPDPVVPGLDRAAVDARVAAGVEDWAERGSSEQVPANKLGNVPAGDTSGLTQAQVDARVAAGVEDWAEAGSADVLPGNKLPPDMLGNSQVRILSPHAIPSADDFAERAVQWNGEVMAPVIREVASGHDRRALFATIETDGDRTAADWGYEIIVKGNYAAMLANKDKHVTVSVRWSSALEFTPGDIVHDSIGRYHVCIRAHTASGGAGINASPRARGQRSWEPYARKEIANRANFLGLYGDVSQVPDADVAEGKWIISTNPSYAVAQRYTGGAWQPYDVPGIGALHGIVFPDNEQAARHIRAFDPAAPDYFIIRNKVKILSFYSAASSSYARYHSRAQYREPPTLEFWGFSQERRIDDFRDDDGEKNTVASYHPSTMLGNERRDIEFLRWKTSASRLWFGAKQGMIYFPNQLEVGNIVGANRRYHDDEGVYFYLHPGIWNIQSRVNVLMAKKRYCVPRILRVNSRGDDDVLAIGDGASPDVPTLPADIVSGSIVKAWPIHVDAGFLEISGDDILYMEVASHAALGAQPIYTNQFMYLRFLGSS